MDIDSKNGLQIYEYLVNHLEELSDRDIVKVTERLSETDLSGQYLASASRYLNAVDCTRYASAVEQMVGAVIDRDREHKYLPELVIALYGSDYEDRATELIATDNNFRRLYKRLNPAHTL